jgi:hypothetical protein
LGGEGVVGFEGAVVGWGVGGGAWVGTGTGTGTGSVARFVFASGAAGGMWRRGLFFLVRTSGSVSVLISTGFVVAWTAVVAVPVMVVATTRGVMVPWGGVVSPSWTVFVSHVGMAPSSPSLGFVFGWWW